MVTTYVQVNRKAAIFTRDTIKIPLDELDKLLEESEQIPDTVRQPNDYHMSYSPQGSNHE